MRDFLKAGVRRLASAWFWALVLLALPNCSFEVGGLSVPPLHLTTGDLPHSSAIMCDIEKFQGPTRRCATADDLMHGIPLTEAAEALATGQASNVGLDYSDAAQAACGHGNPQAIDFQGSFPDGFAVCLNCGGVIPAFHADATAVCVAQCQDLVEAGMAPFPPDTLAFCTANAHPSTNFPESGCFDNACSMGGTLRPDFADPRRLPEPVVWTDFNGTMAVGNNLTRTAPTTGPDYADLNAGAVSTQWITHGDAYVEFEAGQAGVSRVAGFTEVPAACPFPCHDTDPTAVDMGFSMSLNYLGRIIVIEHGMPPADFTQPDGSWGSYTVGERFRVNLKDNHDGTAAVTYTRVVGTCVPGNPCNEELLYTNHLGQPAHYPLRVDTTFREQNGSLVNVNIVRIQ